MFNSLNTFANEELDSLDILMNLSESNTFDIQDLDLLLKNDLQKQGITQKKITIKNLNCVSCVYEQKTSRMTSTIKLSLVLSATELDVGHIIVKVGTDIKVLNSLNGSSTRSFYLDMHIQSGGSDSYAKDLVAKLTDHVEEAIMMALPYHP